METQTVYEIIGYVGSGLVVVSLMMRSVLRLRVVNLVGAFIFTVYGVLIQAWPVVGMNAAIVLIDVYYLRQMLPQRPDHFDVIESSPASVYVQRFLDFHRADIGRFVPEWEGLRGDHRVFLVLRNAVPAGVVIARDLGDGDVRVDLDYVVPEQRDFRPGEWVYDRSGVFRANGWRRVQAAPGNTSHQHYLERMGFTATAGDHRLELA